MTPNGCCCWPAEEDETDGKTNKTSTDKATQTTTARFGVAAFVEVADDNGGIVAAGDVTDDGRAVAVEAFSGGGGPSSSSEPEAAITQSTHADNEGRLVSQGEKVVVAGYTRLLVSETRDHHNRGSLSFQA